MDTEQNKLSPEELNDIEEIAEKLGETAKKVEETQASQELAELPLDYFDQKEQTIQSVIQDLEDRMKDMEHKLNHSIRTIHDLIITLGISCILIASGLLIPDTTAVVCGAAIILSILIIFLVFTSMDVHIEDVEEDLESETVNENDDGEVSNS